MATVPESHIDLLERETFAAVGTTMPDGTPHVTPVWIDHDGGDVLFNTADGRQKVLNMRRTGRAGVMVFDPEDPYRYLSVRGEVVALTTEGAVEHIHELSRQYTGREYQHLDEEDGDRLTVRIRPRAVVTSG
ncbi:MAG: PPOX class F420-dependent oxidoreductase [Halobacteriaceae archaeon]